MKKEISSILNLISMGSLHKALDIALQEHKNDENNKDIIKLIIKIYSLIENYNEGISILRDQIQKNDNKNDYDFTNNMGFFLLKVEEYEEAIEYLNAAIKINPEAPSAYSNLSEIYLVLRNFDLASSYIDIALEKNKKINSNIDNYFYSISIWADINTAKGFNEKTVEFFLEILNEEFNSNIFYLLSTINPSSIAGSIVNEAEKLIVNNNIKFKTKIEKFHKVIPLYFGLAYFYQKKNIEKSEKNFHLANSEIFNILRYNSFSYQKHCSQVISTYKNFLNDLSVEDKKIGENNFFIVGTPRSGTTLVESIITANNDVFPAGELKSFSDLCKPLLNLETESLVDIKNTIIKNYIQRTNFIKKEYNFVVDKLPGNFMFLGFISKIFPGSKVIRMFRDPWDTAISLYKQRYVQNIPYSASFFNIGVFMANFEAINLFWDSIIDTGNFVSIRYEDLVKNKEKYQKHLYDFLAIESDYDDKKRDGFFAKTASIQQVQKAIYSSSINKEEFLDHKNEFFEALLAQRKYWQSKDIDYSACKDNFFGYNIE